MQPIRPTRPNFSAPANNENNSAENNHNLQNNDPLNAVLAALPRIRTRLNLQQQNNAEPSTPRNQMLGAPLNPPPLQRGNILNPAFRGRGVNLMNRFNQVADPRSPITPEIKDMRKNWFEDNDRSPPKIG